MPSTNHAFYNWTREMPKARRFVTMTSVVLQGYAFYALWTRSLVWPMMRPTGPLLYAIVWMLYMLGYGLVNAMLTSEFLRKTQLESDGIAAQQIQRTLQPDRIEHAPGYQLEPLVRSIANTEPGRINTHLSRYTPSDRFATAVFMVLSRDSGELTYVNAGHNPPMMWSPYQRRFWSQLACRSDCSRPRRTKPGSQ